MKPEKIMKNFLLSFNKKQRKKFLEGLAKIDKDLKRIDEIRFQETRKLIEEAKNGLT